MRNPATFGAYLDFGTTGILSSSPERFLKLGGGKVEMTRFKGLGEMQSVHLSETTMDVTKRTLLKVDVPHAPDTEARRQAMDTRTLVENLMGRKPEKRYAFIQEHAKFARDLDV